MGREEGQLGTHIAIGIWGPIIIAFIGMCLGCCFNQNICPKSNWSSECAQYAILVGGLVGVLVPNRLMSHWWAALAAAILTFLSIGFGLGWTARWDSTILGLVGVAFGVAFCLTKLVGDRISYGTLNPELAS